MKRFKNFFLYTLLIIAALMTPVLASAGPSDPTPPDPCGDPGDPLCPIDGGVSLLIAVGIGIAAKKAHDQKKTYQLK